MEAVLRQYGKRKIIDIYYTSTETDWTAMVGQAKAQCGIQNEHCGVIFTPDHRPREVRDEGR